MTAKRRKRVFLTGATGAMGLAGVRALIAAGHEVVGTTHSRRSAAALDDLGATAIDVNILTKAPYERRWSASTCSLTSRRAYRWGSQPSG